MALKASNVKAVKGMIADLLKQREDHVKEITRIDNGIATFKSFLTDEEMADTPAQATTTAAAAPAQASASAPKKGKAWTPEMREAARARALARLGRANVNTAQVQAAHEAQTEIAQPTESEQADANVGEAVIA